MLWRGHYRHGSAQDSKDSQSGTGSQCTDFTQNSTTRPSHGAGPRPCEPLVKDAIRAEKIVGGCVRFDIIIKHTPEAAEAGAKKSETRTVTQTPAVDLVFCVDLTGSMGSWHSQVVTDVTKIVQGVQEQFKESASKPKVGFVA